MKALAEETSIERLSVRVSTKREAFGLMLVETEDVQNVLDRVKKLECALTEKIRSGYERSSTSDIR